MGALKKLINGNKKYILSKSNDGNISIDKRVETFNFGQKPYAVIITCSDSRVIPEHIFMTGLGELFVIRNAGNVISEYGLGSIEYAVSHLGCKLVMVMGHSDCGAVTSAVKNVNEGFITMIVKEIKRAIKGEKDILKASELNVYNSIKRIKESDIISEELNKGLKLVGAMYHLDTGIVEIL